MRFGILWQVRWGAVSYGMFCYDKAGEVRQAMVMRDMVR